MAVGVITLFISTLETKDEKVSFDALVELGKAFSPSSYESRLVFIENSAIFMVTKNFTSKGMMIL